MSYSREAAALGVADGNIGVLHNTPRAVIKYIRVHIDSLVESVALNALGAE